MLKRLARAWKRHGFQHMPSMILRNIRYYATHGLGRPNVDEFDRTYGTETSGIREIGSLDIDSENARYAIRYQPSPVEEVRTVISNLGIELSKYSFIDFGAGKGRVLLLASEFPFAQIIGVEFSRELHLIAQNNIAIYRNPNQRCKKPLSVWSDAAQFTIPAGPLVCYFNNPFVEEVMQQVVSNLECSLQDDPRDVFTIYFTPVHQQIFENSPWWKIVCRTTDYAIFQSKGIHLTG